jgi:hypothetical protein
MSCLATLCDDCQRAYLVPIGNFEGGVPGCKRCNGALRVIPSCSYADQDQELFDELAETVAEACIFPSEAKRLAAQVTESLFGGQFGTTFEMLSIRLPGLVPIQTVVGGNTSAQRRVFRMLKTILDALALTRQSGMIPAVSLPPVAKRPA